MRICHVAHYLPPNGRGGVENYTVHLARAQARREDTVALYARGARTDVAEGEEETSERFGDGITVVESHPGPARLLTEDRLRLLQGDRFSAFLERFRPDIVHFQHLLYHSLDYVARARRVGAATVVTLHDFWMDCPRIQRVDFQGKICTRAVGRGCLPCVWGGARSKLIPESLIATLARTPTLDRLVELDPVVDELESWSENSRRCLEQADAVLSPSRFLAEALGRNGLSSVNLSILDYGIPRPNTSALEAVENARRAGSEPALLHFGMIGLHRLKGTDVAVEAFRRLSDLPVRLHLFGADSYPNAPSNVRIGGRYTAEEIERVYGTFDTLIVPSIWFENAPFVIREAFARQRPVIVSNIGGMKESVRDGVDGLHFAVGDPEALSACIRRLVTEPGLWERLRDGIEPPCFEDDHLDRLDGLYGRLRSARSGESVNERA